MADISSIGHGPIGALDRTSALRSREATDDSIERPLPAPARPGSDTVELSDHARLLDQIRRLPDGRLDRVESVREAIAAGTYDTEDKLTLAIERMLDDLG